MSWTALEQKSASGQIPLINPPQSSIEYVVNMNSNKGRIVPLSAIVDPDVTRVHWFADDVYIGSANSGEVLSWKTRPCSFHIRAVDDHGRGAAKPIKVIPSHSKQIMAFTNRVNSD